MFIYLILSIAEVTEVAEVTNLSIIFTNVSIMNDLFVDSIPFSNNVFVIIIYLVEIINQPCGAIGIGDFCSLNADFFMD